MNQNMEPPKDPVQDGTTPPADRPAHYVTAPPPKTPKTVTLAGAIGSLVTVVILAVLVTFSLTVKFRDTAPDMTVAPGQETTAICDDLNIIDKLFHAYTVGDLDDEALRVAVLKAYVAATGDRYAEYFTAEEYEAQISQQNGEMCGIGVSVINDLVTQNGVTYQAMIIANVYADSPAMEAGLLPGDAIVLIGTGEDAVMVDDIGYTEALARLRGEEGSEANFTVWRDDEGKGDYTAIHMTVVRKKITTHSVLFHVCDTDSRVGVVRLTGFDNTTAEQFEQAMDQLIAAGCTYFIYDLRNNGGGLLTAVEDVLTFFLQEGDVMLYTRDREGNRDTYTVTVKDGKVTSGSGQYKQEDVGKYRAYPLCVLVNGNTASAAELFTANMRDHALGQVVGTRTFGKGTMQTTRSLKDYGLPGALKLTTRFYDPPCGENYDGKDKGIVPHVEVELSEEAQQININLLPDDKDNQLQEAVRILTHP